MEVKLFEVRDVATFIPCIAIKLTYENREEHYLLRRAGYSDEQICSYSAASNEQPYVLFGPVTGGHIHYDPYESKNLRTYGNAHMHIINNWSMLKSGDVIDVEFITGESSAPKTSERLTHG